MPENENMCEALSLATKLTPKPNENGFLFTRRLIKALAHEDFPADEWDTLSDETQQWVNEQIRATNENKQVDEVPGWETHKDGSRFKSAKRSPRAALNGGSTDAEEVEHVETAADYPVEDVEHADADAEVAEEKVLKPKRIAKAAAGSFKKRTDGKPSGIVRIKELLIEDDSLTPAQITERLESEQYTLSNSTIISCKADFKATVSLLRSKGLLTGALA